MDKLSLGFFQGTVVKVAMVKWGHHLKQEAAFRFIWALKKIANF